MPLLDIRGLTVRYGSDEGWVPAVGGVELSIDRGETVCIVGESGSGKSVTALSVLRLLPPPPRCVAEGELRWQGRDLLRLPPADMRRIRGREIAIVFQEPM